MITPVYMLEPQRMWLTPITIKLTSRDTGVPNAPESYMDETNKDEHQSVNDADGGETVEPKTTSEVDDKSAQIAADQRKRAEKAEAENKALKAKLAEAAPRVEEKQINTQSPDPDELRLIARGLSDLEIEQLHVISKGKSISLMESLKDPMFVSFQKDLKEQEKKEKAKLGGTNSSSQGSDPEPLVKPGMTEEEHKKAFSKMMGK